MNMKSFQMRRRGLSVVLSAALACSLSPSIALTQQTLSPVTAVAAESVSTVAQPGDTLIGGMVIQQSGTYKLGTMSRSGTVVIKGDNLDVKIVGQSFPDGKVVSAAEVPDTATYTDFHVDVQGNNVTVTLESAFIDLAALDAAPAFDFHDYAGALNVEGVCLIERTDSAEQEQDVTKVDPHANPTIHVGQRGSLVLGGTGTLFGFKGNRGAFIGGLNAYDANYSEPSGAITFESGTWLLKGSETGATVGNDAARAGAPITVKGGHVVVLTKARGAALGSSNQGVCGDIVLEGGSLEAYTSYSGSAIGAGAAGRLVPAKVGRLIVKGGSLVAGFASNALNANVKWDFPTTGPAANWVAANQNATSQSLLASDVAVSAVMSDGFGNPVSPLIIDNQILVQNLGQDGAARVLLDGAEAYNGGMGAYTAHYKFDDTYDTVASFVFRGNADGNLDLGAFQLSLRASRMDHLVTFDDGSGFSQRFRAVYKAASDSFDLEELDEGVQSLVGAEISGLNSSYTLSGAAVLPMGITVHAGGKQLEQGVDYKLVYANNDKVGTATLNVVGIGKYCGTVSRTFLISAAAPGTSGGAGATTPGGAGTTAPAQPPVTPGAPTGPGSAAGSTSAPKPTATKATQTLKLSAISKSIAASKLNAKGKLKSVVSYTLPKATGAKTPVTYTFKASAGSSKKYLTFKASTRKLTVAKNAPVGTYTGTLTATAKAGTVSGKTYGATSKQAKVTVVVGAQTLRLGTSSKAFTAKALKSKAQTFKVKTTVSSGKISSVKITKAVNAKGKAVKGFKVSEVNNKQIKVTVPRKLGKGTYKLTVQVTAAKATRYAKMALTKTITVKVK